MLNFYRLVLLTLFAAPLAAQITPTISITVNPTVACTGRQFSLNVLSSDSILSADWTVFPSKDVAMIQGSGNQLLLTLPKDLTYTVTVAVSTPGGTISGKRQITAYRSAVSAFNASLTSSGFPSELVLSNFSKYQQGNVWIYSDESVPDSTFSPVKNYAVPGSYSVSLVALGNRGCNDTSSYAFKISDSSYVRLPNVFTPNRDDVNDIFRPETGGIRELHAYILNREGVMIHSWHKVNGFWDGRTTSGEACTDGLYFVVLEASGFDGKNYKLKGPVTLIR